MTSLLRTSARLLAVASAAVGTLVVLGSLAPAHADVPVGWNDDPESVNLAHALLLLAGLPVLLFVAIAVAVYLPSLARGERISPVAPTVTDQWLGGPRRGTAQLAAPDSDGSAAGGARGSW